MKRTVPNTDAPADLWPSVLASLEQTISKPLFEMWVKRIRYLGIDGSELRLGVDSGFARDRIAALEPKLIEAAERTLGRAIRVKIAIAPEEVANGEQMALLQPVVSWPEAVRNVPNALIRSALFGIRPRGKRDYLENVSIEALETYDIVYTGPTLRQDDLDVFTCVVHRFRTLSRDSIVHVSLLDLANDLGLGRGSNVYGKIKKSIVALQSGQIQIGFSSRNEIGERDEYIGPLLRDSAYNAQTRTFGIRLNPEIFRYFEIDNTWLRVEQRRALAGYKDLSRWLHAFFSSNSRGVYDIKVSTYQRLSGSTTNVRFFRRDLRVALEELVSRGFLRTWSIEPRSDLVHVELKETRAVS